MITMTRQQDTHKLDALKKELQEIIDKSKIHTSKTITNDGSRFSASQEEVERVFEKYKETLKQIKA